MRKTSLVLLGAAAGAALTLMASQPRLVLMGASAKAAVHRRRRRARRLDDRHQDRRGRLRLRRVLVRAVPPLALGAILSRHVHRRIDGRVLRAFVLAFAIVSGAVLLFRG